MSNQRPDHLNVPLRCPRVVPVRRFRYSSLGDGTLLFPTEEVPGAGAHCCLINETACFILCHGDVPRKPLSQLLAREFEVSPEQALADVDRFDVELSRVDGEFRVVGTQRFAIGK
jgi:hypothetical protein